MLVLAQLQCSCCSVPSALQTVPSTRVHLFLVVLLLHYATVLQFGLETSQIVNNCNFLLVCLCNSDSSSAFIVNGPFGVEVKVTCPGPVPITVELHLKYALNITLAVLSWVMCFWTICYSGYCRWTYYNIWSYCTTICCLPHKCKWDSLLACLRYCYNSCG
jgi:hypothetical protein